MIYIVIAVFNRLNYTKACLTSLYDQNIDDFKIVVVDHGSTDGTGQYIRDNFPEIELLQGSSDLWWTGAMNIGVKWILERAGANDLVLTLNNDLIVDSDYLESLMSLHNKFPKALIGSVSVDIFNNEKIVFAGIKYNNITAKYKAEENISLPHSVFKLNKEYCLSDLLPGRGTLIPVEAFKEAGVYDEVRFPHYSADEDFSLQCKRKGYKLIVSVNAVVKSYVEDTGLNLNHKEPGISRLKQHLSSIKSKHNLLIRFRWAKKNSPYPYLFYLLDLLRRFGSYIRKIY